MKKFICDLKDAFKFGIYFAIYFYTLPFLLIAACFNDENNQGDGQ